MFESHGKIEYSEDDGLRVVLKVEQDIADYYRKLIPRACRVQRQGWAAHITVVRPGTDEILKHRFWEDHKDEIVKFHYDPCLLNGNGFYWFNAWSLRLEEIRSELGLHNYSKYPLIPKGFSKTFHCTVARYAERYDGLEAPEK